MDRRLDQALSAIELACAGIEAALGEEDWSAVARRNHELNARVEDFGALIDRDRNAPAAGAVEQAAARLGRVLEHHGRLAERLFGDREAAGRELTELRVGRRAATHYLDTAEG